MSGTIGRWVLSQDRDCIQKISDVERIYVDGKEIIALVNRAEITLGEYRNDEKALSVFKSIAAWMDLNDSGHCVFKMPEDRDDRRSVKEDTADV